VDRIGCTLRELVHDGLDAERDGEGASRGDEEGVRSVEEEVVVVKNDGGGRFLSEPRHMIATSPSQSQPVFYLPNNFR
jgi:hypothetical protein